MRVHQHINQYANAAAILPSPMSSVVVPVSVHSDTPRSVCVVPVEIETHTDTHAIVVECVQRKSLLSRFRGRGAANRYVVSVDEYGEVTMIPAEPKRS